MNGGWIKLYYKLLDWEWLDCPEMVGLWINLLLRAAREDRKWHGMTIRRGQLLTTRAELAEMCGLSVQTLRTCIDRLKSTSEITSQSTSQGTLITITKYDCYQSAEDADQPANQPADQPATNQRLTSDQPAINQRDASIPISSSSKSEHTLRREEGKKEISPNGDTKKEKIGDLFDEPDTAPSKEFVKFQEWVAKNAPRVAKLDKPFTEEQFCRLRSEYTGEQVRAVLKDMNNFKPLLKKYVSAYETCLNWLRRDSDRASPPASPSPKKSIAQPTKSVNDLWQRDST